MKDDGTEFLASLSHELRIPLNAILGSAQLLLRDRRRPLSASHRERVQRIVKGGEHLLRLLDDLRDFSHLEAPSSAIALHEVDVREVIVDVTHALEPLAVANGVGLEIVPPPTNPTELPRVAADRTRLLQVLVNFGSNAIKYNHRGGRVVFGIAIPNASAVRVSVRDTGMGIPIESQSKLFRPFERAGRENGPIEGSGIGLAIAKRLAEQMGASIGFRSRPEPPDQGSEFWIDVHVHGASTGSRLVLYVDDTVINVEFMRDLFASVFDDLELVSVPNAEQGIELARARSPRLIFMDLRLPGMNGFDALKRLRERPETSEIPVVALTAEASEQEKQRGLREGFQRYLTQPVRVDEVIDLVRTFAPDQRA